MMILSAALMLMLLAFSRQASDAALSAARCFVYGVMPSLAPMMVLARLIPAAAGDEHSKAGCFLRSVFFGFAAGSPAAAQRTAQLSGIMSRRLWESLLCLSGVMSPMFFTGTLAGWLQSRTDGWKLLLIHWAGAALAAALWYAFARPKEAPPPSCAAPRERMGLPAAISQSAHALLCILGAMVVFSAFSGLLQSLLGVLFPRWTTQNAPALSLLHALLEAGGGASAICQSMQKPHAALCAACGFGGLSILLQNLLFLEGRIRPTRLAAMRGIHALVSLLLGWLIF